MGLFQRKKSKNELGKYMEQMKNSMFPKGPKDIKAGTEELLHILDNKIDYETAQSIFIKSVSISRIAEKFDEARLKIHLQGYCLQYFNDAQVKQFHGYLVALASAMMIHRKTPSEVKRQGDAYIW